MLQAREIIGASIVEGSHGWGPHIIEYFALGTAVISISDTHQIQAP